MTNNHYQQSQKKVIEEFEKHESKVLGHSFDGSCLYNNNENGKGHETCRFPYNPGRENPSGLQCLKLPEEHWDFKNFLTTTCKSIYLAGLEAAKGRVVEESKIDEAIYSSQDFQSTHDESDGWNSARTRTLENITTLQEEISKI